MKTVLRVIILILLLVRFSDAAGDKEVNQLYKETYRYDIVRSGYADVDVSLPLKLNWFINTTIDGNYYYDPKVKCSIVGDSGVLYFGAVEQKFSAYDTATEQFKWSYQTAGNVHASATIVGDEIYFGDSKGYLYCMNKISGELEWKRRFNNEVLSSPLIVDDRIYFSDMDDTLFCVSNEAGEVIWKVESRNYVRDVVIREVTSPSYSNGMVYQGFSDGYLYCYDAKLGKEIFRKKVRREGMFFDVDSPAAIDGKSVYTSSFDGRFIAINSTTPTSKWEIEIKGNGYPAFSGSDLIVSSSDGVLYKVDKEYGNILWEKELSPNL
ncbi:PQQ-binding-like beta-propeller repeat protein, partial [Thermodesulfobacteriota bacterium]